MLGKSTTGMNVIRSTSVVHPRTFVVTSPPLHTQSTAQQSAQPGDTIPYLPTIIDGGSGKPRVTVTTVEAQPAVIHVNATAASRKRVRTPPTATAEAVMNGPIASNTPDAKRVRVDEASVTLCADRPAVTQPSLTLHQLRLVCVVKCHWDGFCKFDL
jgi:hypothetical protein